ncbi:MAG: hypothetical protein ABR911_13155 [Syntrophales bacterium]|jgi:hypothetical protein
MSDKNWLQTLTKSVRTNGSVEYVEVLGNTLRFHLDLEISMETGTIDSA